MKSDEEFHEYAHAHPDAFVALILGEAPARPYAATTLGLKRTVRELDLGLLPVGHDGFAYLTEVLGYDRPTIERDLFEKAVLAAGQHGLWGRVRPVVIYLERRFARGVLPPVLGPGVDLAPIRIVLGDLRPAELLRRSPEHGASREAVPVLHRALAGGYNHRDARCAGGNHEHQGYPMWTRPHRSR